VSDAGDGTRPPGHEEVGSVADEAAKLLGALSGWAREHGPDLGHGVSDMAGGAASAMRDVNEHIATGSAECVYCPVCRTIHYARSLNPEVRQHLATAAASLMQAAAGVLAAAAADDSRASAARGDDIEKIDVDDEWPDED
jgi:hypothetical protein